MTNKAREGNESEPPSRENSNADRDAAAALERRTPPRNTTTASNPVDRMNNLNLSDKLRDSVPWSGTTNAAASIIGSPTAAPFSPCSLATQTVSNQVLCGTFENWGEAFQTLAEAAQTCDEDHVGMHVQD